MKSNTNKKTITKNHVKVTNATINKGYNNTNTNTNTNNVSKVIVTKDILSKIKTRLTNDGYHIDVTTIPKELVANIEVDLTMIPYKLDATKEDMEKSKFNVFKYSNNRLEIIVPRYYGVLKFGPPQKEEFNPEEIAISFKQSLREVQQDVCDRSIEYIKRNGGGLLSVPCGFGKTVCALYMAQRLGLKTLIVVHKSFLIKQWIESMFKFLDIDKNKIGIIKQSRCDVKGKDMVVGMLQTIAKRDYKNLFNEFGLVIYDEAHHVACKFYSKTLLKTCTQYTLALTATPYRGDGLIKVMYWFLGGTMYRERLKVNKNVIVKIIKYRSTDKKLFSVKKRWLKGKVRQDPGRMATNICKIDDRNDAIIDMITHIRRTEPDRKILILSGRKSQLVSLKTGVDDYIQDDIDKGLIDADEFYSCYYVGETKPEKRQEAEENGDIIFATYDMANEGLDIKHLNTVILASPKKDVMQSIGRIMRTILKTGDLKPMVIDMADDLGVINSWLSVRKSIYTSCKYEIETLYMVDKQFVTHNGFDEEPDDVDNMHHPNPYIHNMINGCNTSHNDFVSQLREFNRISRNIHNRLYGSNYEEDHNIIDITKTEPKYDDLMTIYEDIEYTNIADILFVPKLSATDFSTEVISNNLNSNKINIDEDIEFDDRENENERNIIQSLAKAEIIAKSQQYAKLTNSIVPKKRLF